MPVTLIQNGQTVNIYAPTPAPVTISAVQGGAPGPPGPASFVAQATAPGDTGLLWVDTDAVGMGFAFTTMTTAQRNALAGADLYRGRVIFNTDTGGLEVYYGATTGWRPPWNTAWGRVNSATASGQSGITAVVDVTGASFSITALANRYYVARFAVLYNGSSPALQEAYVSDASNTVLGQCRSVQDVTIAGNNVTLENTSLPFTFAGAQTVKLRMGRSGGDIGTYVVVSGFVSLEDIGPAGNAPAS